MRTVLSTATVLVGRRRAGCQTGCEHDPQTHAKDCLSHEAILLFVIRFFNGLLCLRSVHHNRMTSPAVSRSSTSRNAHTPREHGGHRR